MVTTALVRYSSFATHASVWTCVARGSQVRKFVLAAIGIVALPPTIRVSVRLLLGLTLMAGLFGCSNGWGDLRQKAEVICFAQLTAMKPLAHAVGEDPASSPGLTAYLLYGGETTFMEECVPTLAAELEPCAKEFRFGTDSAQKCASGRAASVFMLLAMNHQMKLVKGGAGSALAPASPATTSRPKRTSPPVKANGTLSIWVEGHATVEIDGKAVGRAPLVGLAIPAGKHVVILENQGGVRKQQEVTIVSGKDTRLAVDFR